MLVAIGREESEAWETWLIITGRAAQHTGCVNCSLDEQFSVKELGRLWEKVII